LIAVVSFLKNIPKKSAAHESVCRRLPTIFSCSP